MKRFGFLTLTLATLALATPAGAQSTPAAMRITNGTVYVGDTSSLVITLEGVRDADAPTIGPVDGLRIAYAGPSSSSSVSIVNGRRTESRTLSLQYTVTAMRAGEFVIPAQTFTADGRAAETNQVRFTAIEPPESENFALRASVEDDTLYLGEPTMLSITWYLAAQPDGFEFLSGLGDVPLETYPTGDPRLNRSGADAVTVILDGEQVVGLVGDDSLDGRLYTTLTITRTIVPTQTGAIEIPPVTVVFDEVVGTQGRSVFRDLRTERRVARSRPLSLRVLPLPNAGRPADFSGLVGRYAIGVSATPADVNVGDPITLRAVVTGSAPLSRVQAGNITTDPAFLEQFKPSPDGWSAATTQGGARVFTTTVRAMGESIDAIPPLRLSYFDTELGEYRVAASDPIPLRVRATREVTAADAIGGLGAPPVARSLLHDGAGGIGAIYTSPAALASQRVRVLDRFSAPVWVAAGALPPTTYFLALGFVAVRRRQDPVAMRRHRAFRRARRRLATDTPAVALRGCVADRFNLDEAAVTSRDALALLAPINEALARDAHDALAMDEGFRFGGDARALDGGRVRSLLRRIEREAGR